MSYKTILVHVDQSKHASKRIRIAANIALAENAHLIGTAMTGISRFLSGGDAVDINDSGLATHWEYLRERASHALEEFELLAREIGVLSVEKRLVDDEAGDGISQQARYCDLVVIGQTDLEEASPRAAPDFPEYVVVHCARPVLIVPAAGHFEHIGKKALIAWDASIEATRAVTGAIAILKQAQKAQVVVFNPATEPDMHGAEPGADIALYLARHNIKVEVVQKNTDVDTGNALLSAASDLSSDLIVMGAYGHSRFREILLGGATRTVLASMTVPVLMSH